MSIIDFINEILFLVIFLGITKFVILLFQFLIIEKCLNKRKGVKKCQ